MLPHTPCFDPVMRDPLLCRPGKADFFFFFKYQHVYCKNLDFNPAICILNVDNMLEGPNAIKSILKNSTSRKMMTAMMNV